MKEKKKTVFKRKSKFIISFDIFKVGLKDEKIQEYLEITRKQEQERKKNRLFKFQTIKKRKMIIFSR